MRLTLSNRHGIGLPIALAAVVIISGIVAAASFSAAQSYRIDGNVMVQERALAAAEEGQARIVRDWSPAWNTLPEGDTIARRYTFADGSSAQTVVTRLNANTFWVASDGAANQSSRQQNARRRTNLLLRLNVPSLRMPGAITSRDATRASGSAIMNGNDVNPLNWGCDAAGEPAAVLAADSLVDVGYGGSCVGGLCMTTSAPSKMVTDTLLRDTAAFGSALGWDELKNQAMTGGGYVMDVSPGIGPHDGLTLTGIRPSYNADGSCNTTDPLNWGDVNRSLLFPGKCEGYFPVIYMRGDVANSYTTISGGSGQGVLIVDGNLKLNGSFTWYGPIIVRGNFKTNGSGSGIRVVGGVMAANSACESTAASSPCNDIAGNTSVQFSRCAIIKAVSKNAKVVQASRGWSELF